MASSSARVVRTVPDSLVYATTAERRTLAFVPSLIAGYTGETFQQLGLYEGSRIDLEWDPATFEVTRASGLAADERPFRGREDEELNLEAVRTKSSPSANQIELKPADEAADEEVVRRAVPPRTREFGKLIDTSQLWPGDLILTREESPDRISRLIQEVQKQGGYSELDSRWTHAAMYVGDGDHVVEATFDSLTAGGDVRLTSLDTYCEGLHSLRFRRSRHVSDPSTGWRLCVRALSKLKRPYSITLIAQTWFTVVVRGRGFFASGYQRPTNEAVVCSTLYSDSYNEAFRRSLGEVNGACVPAWLSACDEFEDVLGRWRRMG